MKSLRIISKISILAICSVCFAACDRDAIYEEEQYKYVVYLLSGAENVFTESYRLDEAEPVRYFSVGVGGSRPNAEEVVVTIEPDRVLMDRYNRNNFDIDESKYARLLSADRYEIESYAIAIPANPVDQYVKVPVKVRPLGLSPDSVYFIPLAIKSVSRYEVNDDKYNMLYRVCIENEYARQRVSTYYAKRGTEGAIILSGLKLVQPLTGNKVRMYAGNYLYRTTHTLDDILRYSIVVEVNEDLSVNITPYGTIEVEMLSAEGYNLYDPEAVLTDKEERMFYLYYRYRLLNANGTYGSWMEVKESLTRVEEE